MCGALRQDHRAVVCRPLREGALDGGLVPARGSDRRFELIGDDQGGYPAEVFQGAGVRPQPVRHLLALAGLGVRVVRRPEHGDEQLHLVELAGGGLDPVGLLAGVVGEHLLASAVHVPHDDALALLPAPVVLAELRVAVAVGVVLAVLQVQQLQRHAGFLQLEVHRLRIGQRSPQLLTLGTIERRFQLGLAQGLDALPAQAGRRRTVHHPADAGHPDLQRAGDVPIPSFLHPLQAQDVFDLPHGQSLRRHPRPPPVRGGGWPPGLPSVRSTSRPRRSCLSHQVTAVIPIPKRMIPIPKRVIHMPKRP